MIFVPSVLTPKTCKEKKKKNLLQPIILVPLSVHTSYTILGGALN
jgi:hypothetical protein